MTADEMSGVQVEEVTEITAELAAELGRLVPQLSSSAALPGLGEFEEIVNSPGAVLLVARDGAKRVLGMLTLITYRIPTGVNAVIEDVVVDDQARGAGTGAALVTAALEEAARRSARHVDLTSRPSREAANRLYQKLGFETRETNVYRRELAKS